MNEGHENIDLVHCIYTSLSADADLNKAALEGILEQSRINNAEREVTGMLLFQDGSFFQVLEGDRPVVEATFEKIAQDKRHTRVSKIIIEPIAERDFGDWSMGYPQIDYKELSSIPGLNDFFKEGRSFSDLEAGRAKTLLDAFKQKSWRL
jgi:hypothetical protein